MSREKKFHQWIEEQNQEEKARVWEKIQEKMDVDRRDEPTVVEEIALNDKPKGIWRKVLAVAGVSVVAVCISVFAVMKFFSDGGIVAGNSTTSERQSDGETSEDGASSENGETSEIPPPTNENRYCTAEEYTRSVTDKTIKQYAQETGKDILYFDWYDTTEYLENSVYTLNETNEIICYRENIINPETGDFLTIYVTEKSTQIDVLDNLNGDAPKIYNYNEVNISWEASFVIGHASFEYGDYKYDIQLKEPLEEDDVLEYAKLLLGE